MEIDSSVKSIEGAKVVTGPVLVITLTRYKVSGGILDFHDNPLMGLEAVQNLPALPPA